MDEENGVVNAGNDGEPALDETGNGAESDGGGEAGGENAGNDTGNDTGDNAENNIDIPGDGEKEKKIQLVYIGPSLTYEKLRTAQILSGTEAEIADFIRPITEKYPEAAHLLVTPETLSDALAKVSSKSSVLHKYYEDMLAKSRDIRKG